MDNWCFGPELFVMLKMQYKVLACGKIHTNRKEWDQSTMNFNKSVSSGKSKCCFKSIRGILFLQWNNNKVVSFISTLLIVCNESTTQQSRIEKYYSHVPNHWLIMINKCDIWICYNKKLRCFYSTIQKMVQKSILRIFDFMLRNRHIPWKMYSEVSGIMQTRWTIKVEEFTLQSQCWIG